MNVSSWSIKNPVPALILFILLTLAGFMGFKAMKIQNFPDLDLPTVNVNAALPGASPEQLENQVARKLENSIAKHSKLFLRWVFIFHNTVIRPVAPSAFYFIANGVIFFPCFWIIVSARVIQMQAINTIANLFAF